MIDIKQYSNGRFFDAINRKYINKNRIKDLIKKGEQIKVTLTTTGEEITDTIIAKYAPKDSEQSTKLRKEGCLLSSDLENTSSERVIDSKKSEKFINTDSMKHWVSDIIDRRVKQAIEIMNLPTRDQIAELNANIKSINDKIDALEASKHISEQILDSKPLKRNPFEEYVKKSNTKKSGASNTPDCKQTVKSDTSQRKAKTSERKTVKEKAVKRSVRKKI